MQLSGCHAQITDCRRHLNSDAVLVSLRSLTEPWLPVLAAPLGFRPHGIGVRIPPSASNTTWGLILRNRWVRLPAKHRVA